MEIITKFEVTPQMIADQMTTLMESGDPVTSARRGGWCYGVYWRERGVQPPAQLTDPWYADASIYGDPETVIAVHEVADETKWDQDADDKELLKTGALVIHKVGLKEIQEGLQKLASGKYAHHFRDIVEENGDAATADIMWQFILFGEEKYA
jgi:hypothetical protein